MSDGGFVISLGEDDFGRHVSADMSAIPHWLIAGATNSGKSKLLQLILYQALRQSAHVFIADFKFGVDWLPIWHKKCKILTKENAVLNLLTDIESEMEKRAKILLQTGCKNMDEYNSISECKVPRLIFACDEAGDLLNKTGNKEHKEIISNIENSLSSIARRSRAFNINLVLAMQRPDHTLLTGQLRSNFGLRILGRCDKILADIVLDSPVAADLIPKNAQGYFITNDEVVFKAYWFDESIFTN